MNLTEYLNQTYPQPRPTVILNADEVKEVGKIYNGRELLKSIEIPKLCEKYNVQRSYIQVGDDLRLRVTDEDGNPGNYSCFYLPIEN